MTNLTWECGSFQKADQKNTDPIVKKIQKCTSLSNVHCADKYA